MTTVHSTWRAESRSFSRLTDVYSLYVKCFTPAFVWAERKTFQATRAFTTTSRAMQREVLAYGVKTDITIIPNIVDTTHFSPANEQKRYDAASVSRLVYRKGILDLIEAVRLVREQLPSFRMAIVGSGPLKGRVRALIREYDLEDTVELVGWLSHEQLLELFRQSKLFVSSALYEPFGLTTVEAMASGLPAVVTDVGGSAEIVDDRSGRIVTANRPQALADSIVATLSNPDLNTMAAAARTQVAERFDRRKVTTQFEEAYRHVSK